MENKKATAFEQQVSNFTRVAASAIFTADFLVNVSFLDAVDALGVTITIVKNLEPEFTDESEGMQAVSIVLKFKQKVSAEEVFVKIAGTRSSYNGLNYENWCLVKPVTKTVQIFE